MPDVNDHMNERAVALSIKAIKLDAELLAKAIQAFLRGGGKLVKRMTTTKDMAGMGKQSVKELTRQGQGVSNVEIDDGNIKAFESVARKYGVDFALKKDKAETPPKWLVFFKARDADALISALREFAVNRLYLTGQKKAEQLQ